MGNTKAMKTHTEHTNTTQLANGARKHTRAEQAESQVQRLQDREDTTTPMTRKRSEKLARQLKSLIEKDAQWSTLCAKAEEVTKAEWREARVADIGRRGGFKASAPRVARRQASLVAAC